jgi:hypothetical protein
MSSEHYCQADWLREQERQLSGQPEFELEKLILDLHRAIVERMDALSLDENQLADAMEASEAATARVLNDLGSADLASVVRIASAVGCRLRFALSPLEDGPRI